MPVWVRRCLSFACLMAVWLVVRPAAASAPLCDEHAASATAPSPVLDTPNESLDVGDLTDGCDGWVSREVSYQRGESPTPVAPSAHGEAVLTDPARGVPPCWGRAGIVHRSPGSARSGVRLVVERPPRG